MKLVVVESPAKAKTIEKYLGPGYKVVASKGHVVDLPKSELGVDPENNFKIKYIVNKPESLKSLKDAFKDKDSLILAVDPDREGEAIGWHIAKEFKLINDKGDIINRQKKLERIVFTEITKEAIQAAVKNPRKIDINLVNAQQARRALDRLVGYKLSPLLWKKIRFGLSAGRVQSVALRLIVDKEDLIKSFINQEYWQISSYLTTKDTGETQIKYSLVKDQTEEPEEFKGMKFELQKINNQKPEIKDQSQAKKIVTEIYQKKWIISSIESRNIERSPKPPFTTSTFQQAASNRFGISAKESMRIAQKLYEAGFITYMRTDSLHLSTEAINKMRSYIQKKFGIEFLPEVPRSYSSKSKLAQEAHEAIRPSNPSKESRDLGLAPKEAKIYDLIRSRALASQVKNAIVESTAVKINIDQYQFQLNGQRIIFAGFMQVHEQSYSENLIPAKLTVGQELFANDLIAQQNFTKPPARYTEASLIKALEAFGIGRPSTYAPTISTIIVRKYVEKIQKYLVPTDTGIIVTRLLVDHFKDIVDTDFTAEIEKELDDIAQGKMDWIKMLEEFYTPFEKLLTKKDKEIKKEDYLVIEKSKISCPICGKKMDVKLGRFGRFLSCPDFPECKGMLSVDGKSEEDIAKEAKSKKFLDIYDPAPQSDSGQDYILKVGRYGKFWAHPEYPKVKDAKPLELRAEIKRKIYGNAPKTKDGKKMILRNGKFGEYWAHPKYPEVKEVQRVNPKEVKAKKIELGII